MRPKYFLGLFLIFLPVIVAFIALAINNWKIALTIIVVTALFTCVRIGIALLEAE